MYNNVFCFFSLSFSVFLCLLVCQFLFLVASFDGLRSLLVTNYCSHRSLANKLRFFIRSYCFGVSLLFKFWTLCVFEPTFGRGGLRDNVRCSSWAHWRARSVLPASVN